MHTPTHRPFPALLCFGLLLCTLCPQAARAEDWYQPVAADFHPLYDRDRADQNYQSWDGHDSYWYWVKTFYEGYTKRVLGVKVVSQEGWTDTSRLLVSHVTSPATRLELTKSFNTLGRTIAGDWAKNEHVCHIQTRDLRRWRDQLTQAGKRDTGSGQAIQAAVRSIQAEADARLKASP